MIGYLCKSLQIISLVWPTRLIFLAMGEVLEFIPLHHVILLNALLYYYELNTLDACWIAVDV